MILPSALAAVGKSGQPQAWPLAHGSRYRRTCKGLSAEPYLALATLGSFVLLTVPWCPGAQATLAKRVGGWRVGAPLASRAGMFTRQPGPMAAEATAAEVPLWKAPGSGNCPPREAG